MRASRLFVSAAALLVAGAAHAQTAPGWSYGYKPTAGEWNYWFGFKQDVLPYTALNRGGDVMQGELQLVPSSTSTAGLNIGVGIAPTSPKDGDVWMTSTGIYTAIGGVAYTVIANGSQCLMAVTQVLAVPPSCISWGTFADALIANVDGSFPVRSSGTWGAKTLGTSVNDPGTGTIEQLQPMALITGASKTYAQADLFKTNRRSNSGSAMTDTLPANTTTGLTNGSIIRVENIDGTANDTVSAGTGTTLTGGPDIITPAHISKYVYDTVSAGGPFWRHAQDNFNLLVASNNLSDVASLPSTRASLGIGVPNPTFSVAADAMGLNLANANTWTATQSFAGSTTVPALNVTNAVEPTTIVSSPPTTVYLSSQSIILDTTNASGNWTTNVTWSAGTTLNTAMTTGQTVTLVVGVKLGTTNYYNSAISIDGNAQTFGTNVFWLNSLLPSTAGDVSCYDVYTYSITKTGTNTFLTLASLVQYK